MNEAVTEEAERPVLTVDPFAARFEVEAQYITPSGSYDIRADDTGTWRRDTEDRDT
jgi:hypothetical protein